MSIENQIKDDLKVAMKNKETNKTSLLRVVIGEFNRVGKSLTDEDALKILKKMVENATILNNTEEINILNGYLPKMKSVAEISMLIDDVIKENGYTSMKDMGNIMRQIKSPMIDNKIASQQIKEKLS